MGLITDYLRAHGGNISFGDDAALIKLCQQALLISGAVLDADGEWGPITEAAVKRFQAANDTPPVGWIGIRTAVLFDKILFETGSIPPSQPSVQDYAPWLSHMRAVTGTKELPGAADSPIIMAWRDDIAKVFPEMAAYGKNYTHDSIAWCGLCMAAAMARAKVRPAFGAKDTDRYLYALSWSRWGKRLDTPRTGCVMVFSRAGGGHVSLLEKADNTTFWIRGGNQSDAVNVMKKPRDTSFVGAFWPTEYQLPAVPIASNISNTVSTGSFA